MKSFKNYFSFLILVLFCYLISCSTAKKDLKESKNILNIAHLKYKIENISNFRLLGINLNNKRKISDFSASEGLKLAEAFNSKKISIDFNLNIDVKNPNDGTNGLKPISVTLVSFDWKLFFNENPIVSGILDSPIDIPYGKQNKIITLPVSFDLYQYFGNKEYEDLIKMALALSNQGGTKKIKLEAVPKLRTAIGQIPAPKVMINDEDYN
jgi:hypothetical protein